MRRRTGMEISKNKISKNTWQSCLGCYVCRSDGLSKAGMIATRCTFKKASCMLIAITVKIMTSKILQVIQEASLYRCYSSNIERQMVLNTVSINVLITTYYTEVVIYENRIIGMEDIGHAFKLERISSTCFLKYILTLS